MEHIKTIISRKKLHNKDFTRDSIEKLRLKIKT